jgi:hypothetical protein
MENSSLQSNTIWSDFRPVINDYLKSKDRCVIKYFNLILNDLKQLSLDQTNFQDIYRSHISIYLDIPLFLAEKIEGIVKTRKENKYLIPTEFMNFLSDFYFSPFQKFEKLIFDIIDLNNTNCVQRHNTIIILKFICTSEENYKKISPTIDAFFDNDEQMDYDEFQKRNKKSPEFLGAIFIMFYFKFPLDLEVLSFLVEQENYSELISLTKLLDQTKVQVSEFYDQIFKKTDWDGKIPEIFKSDQNFITDSDIKFKSYNPSLKKKITTSFIDKLYSDKKHSSTTLYNVQINREEIDSSIPLSNEKNDLSCEIYDKLSKKFIPVKLILTNKFLIFQKINVSPNYPSHLHYEIINLSAYFPHLNKKNELLSLGINNKEFSVSLFPKKTQIIPSINRVFFFKSKNDMELFYDTISTIMNYQSFSSIYYAGELIYQNDNFKTYAGMNIKLEQQVAIKIIDKKNIDNHSIKYLISENDISNFLKIFPNEYIVKQIEIMEDKNFIYSII